MSISEERLKQLRTQAKESDKTLIELTKQIEPLLNKNDPESRIKKLELQLQGFYHGWISSTVSQLELLNETGIIMRDISRIVERVIDQLPKITKDSGLADKEIVAIKQELEEQKKKIADTLQPIKQMIQQAQENQIKGNDIYG